MKQAIISALLIAWTAPAQAAEPAATGKVGLLLSLPPDNRDSHVGAGVSIEFTPSSHSFTASVEGVNIWSDTMKAWSAWLAWPSLTWYSHHSLSVLGGYNQSILMFPRLGLGGPNQSDWDPPSLLVGVSYQWANGPFALRLSPHLAAGLWDQHIDVFYSTMRSYLAGPPLLEISWQALDHVELGLRVSYVPVRASWTF